MEGLVADDTPRSLIKEVLSDRGLLSLVASRSYEHANHFYKILLISSREPAAYRLSAHHWQSGYDDRLLATSPYTTTDSVSGPTSSKKDVGEHLCGG